MAQGGLHMRILMATWNGARHLPEQLDSFLAQSHENWTLSVSDDGSSDRTGDLLGAFAAAYPARVAGLHDGPGQGSAANFLSLLARATQEAPEAAMAFSDQDDVWHAEKLARAADWMTANGAGEGAALAWVCRTVLTDADLVPTGESRSFPRPPAFGNALVQNILAGNTIVLSPAAARAVARTVASARTHGVPFHDWWIYQVVTGMGGMVGMEPEPLVMYRQHDTNHLGHHDPVRGRLARLGIVMRRNYARWLDANTAALADHTGLLAPEERALLRRFMAARGRGGRHLARALRDLGLHRQTRAGDRSLRMLALAGRM